MSPGADGCGDWFDARPRERLLRRLLLALRIPPSLVFALARSVPGAGGRERRGAFAARFSRWHAFRRSSTRSEWTRATRGIPVLLYHAFGDEPDRYVVSPRAFARQMRLLSLLRCRVLPCRGLVDALAGDRLLPSRTVVLSVDDGYVDNSDAVSDAAARHGFGATIFVSGRPGGVNDWSESEPLRGRRLLSRDDLLALQTRGVELGAHTRLHADLTGLDDRALAEELASSRAELEEILGEPVRTLAYPYGRFDERVAAAARAAGFEGACTVVARSARLDDDPFRVPRIEIEGSDSLLAFLVKVGTGWA